MKRNKFFPEKLYCLQGDISKFSYFHLQLVMASSISNGNTKKAKEFFDRGRERGARKFMIMQILRNKEATEKLTKSLESLGSLD